MTTIGDVINTLLEKHGSELDGADLDAIFRRRMDAYTERLAEALGVGIEEVCIEYKTDGFIEVGWSVSALYCEDGVEIRFRFGWRGEHEKGSTLDAACADVLSRAGSWREEAHEQWVEIMDEGSPTDEDGHG